jgi:hypothetical protein
MSLRDSRAAMTGFTTVRTAIEAAERETSAIAVLIVGLEDCPSCEILKEDLERIAGAASGFALYQGTLDESSDERDYAAVARLNLSGFPTTLVFDRGTPVHGWVGHNHQLSRNDRCEALDALLRTAVKRIAALSGRPANPQPLPPSSAER